MGRQCYTYSNKVLQCTFNCHVMSTRPSGWLRIVVNLQIGCASRRFMAITRYATCRCFKGALRISKFIEFFMTFSCLEQQGQFGWCESPPWWLSSSCQWVCRVFASEEHQALISDSRPSQVTHHEQKWLEERMGREREQWQLGASSAQYSQEEELLVEAPLSSRSKTLPRLKRQPKQQLRQPTLPVLSF